MKTRLIGLTIALLALPVFCQQASFTKGPARQIDSGLFDCGSKSRVSAVGIITTYTNQTIGVDNKPGYMNFTEVFDTPGADAQFIWSSNVILDNLVLVRKTIR